MMFLQSTIKLFVLLSVSCLLLSCNSLGKSENEKLISGKEEYYSINPVMLMSAIYQGEKENLFVQRTPFADQSEMWLLPEEKSLYWEQDDYFQIAQVLNEYIGNGSLEDWKIKMIYLESGCTNIGFGFTRGSLRFFRVDRSFMQGTRTVLTMDMLPWRKIIRTYEALYSPILENWESLDLQKIKISSKQAVDVAEKNGGSDARTKVENKCSVIVSMIAPGSVYDGWTVRYKTSDENSEFNTIYEVLVDPQDGKFQVVPLP